MILQIGLTKDLFCVILPLITDIEGYTWYSPFCDLE